MTKKLLVFVAVFALLGMAYGCGEEIVDDGQADISDEQPDDLVVEEPLQTGIIAETGDIYAYECEIVFTDLNGIQYDLDGDIYCNSAMHSAVSPDQRFLLYVDFPNIVIFDSQTEEEKTLMSVLDDTDGVDFYWAPDSRTIAMSVINQNNESYHETYGSKLYVLKIDEYSELVEKERYLLKIRHECHDAGCNVGEDDLYFVDNNTLVYRTWDDDPYEAAGDDSFLRTLEIN